MRGEHARLVVLAARLDEAEARQDDFLHKPREKYVAPYPRRETHEKLARQDADEVCVPGDELREHAAPGGSFHVAAVLVDVQLGND